MITVGNTLSRLHGRIPSEKPTTTVNRPSVPAGMAVIAKTEEEKCEVVYKLAYER